MIRLVTIPLNERMCMCVDEAGHQRSHAQIDDLGPRGDHLGTTDRDDAIALDQNSCVLDRPLTLAIDELTTEKTRAFLSRRGQPETGCQQENRHDY